MKRYRAPIEVECDPAGRPVGFGWRGRAYRVGSVQGCWVEDTGWWTGGGRVVLWRLEATAGGGLDGVFELVSRDDDGWLLDRQWD